MSLRRDRIGKMEDLSSVLKAKIERLTVQNAGLRAHNETLLDAESGTATPDQASPSHTLLCCSAVSLTSSLLRHTSWLLSVAMKAKTQLIGLDGYFEDRPS